MRGYHYYFCPMFFQSAPRFSSFAILLLLCFSHAKSQTNTDSKPREEAFLRYQRSLAINDMTRAIDALHNLVSIEGESSVYKDTLAHAYYQYGNYKGAYRMAQELLEIRPKDASLHEFNAVCALKLGLVKYAADHYASAFGWSKKSIHAFHAAKNYNEVKAFQLALSAIQSAESNISGADFSQFVFYTQAENKLLKVVLPAAIFNLKGLIQYNLDDEKGALTSFKKALKFDSDFKLALDNLKLLESSMKQN
jgi:tetratricopeptide (TPR) repeat protein